MSLPHSINEALRPLKVDAQPFKTADDPRHHADHQDTSLAALLKISGALQTSLDIQLVIQVFYDSLVDLFGACALNYANSERGLNFSHGIASRNKCHYQLSLHGKVLGEVTVSRRKRLQKSEIVLLENLLCTLVNPLNNALLYQDALAAALRDPLTNLNNRRALEATLVREIELAKRNRSSLSLINVDIDHFKKINDSYGHLVGDRVICHVAELLRHAVRSCDMVFRYGGEEFVIVLNSTNPNGARLLAERVRKAIAAGTIEHPQGEFKVTASFGVAAFDADDDSEHLFAKADAALYQAKREGRNCTMVYENSVVQMKPAPTTQMRDNRHISA